MDPQLKKNILSILTFIHEFCVQNHVNYFITGGTLKGAIETGGFLEGDKDADIGMLREDYERFVNLLLDNAQNLAYSVENYLTNIRCSFLYTKIRMKSQDADQEKAYVDVYPFDAMPRSRFKQKLQLMTKKYYSGLLFASFKKNRLGFFESMFFQVLLVAYKDRKQLYENANRNLRKYNNDKAPEYVCGLEGGHGSRESLRTEDALKVIEVPFCGISLFSPSNPTDLITKMYSKKKAT